MHTTIEEKFEQVTAKHEYECEGTLLVKLRPSNNLLVNGPNRTLRILDPDLKLLCDLERKILVLSDQTRVMGRTWRDLKEQVMRGNLDISELSEEDQYIINELIKAQRETGGEGERLVVEPGNDIADEIASCAVSDYNFLFVGCGKGVITVYD